MSLLNMFKKWCTFSVDSEHFLVVKTYPEQDSSTRCVHIFHIRYVFVHKFSWSKKCQGHREKKRSLHFSPRLGFCWRSLVCGRNGGQRRCGCEWKSIQQKMSGFARMELFNPSLPKVENTKKPLIQSLPGLAKPRCDLRFVLRIWPCDNFASFCLKPFQGSLFFQGDHLASCNLEFWWYTDEGPRKMI